MCVSVATGLGSGAGNGRVPVGTFPPADALGLCCECAWPPWGLHVSTRAGKEQVRVMAHGFYKDPGLLLPNEGKEDF